MAAYSLRSSMGFIAWGIVGEGYVQDQFQLCQDLGGYAGSGGAEYRATMP